MNSNENPPRGFGGAGPSSHSQGQFPQGQFPQGQFPQGQFPQGQLPQGQFPQGQFPQGQFPQGQFPQGQFPQGQFPQGQLPQGQFPQGQFPQGQFPQGQPYPGQPWGGAASPNVPKKRIQMFLSTTKGKVVAALGAVLLFGMCSRSMVSSSLEEKSPKDESAETCRNGYGESKLTNCMAACGAGEKWACDVAELLKKEKAAESVRNEAREKRNAEELAARKTNVVATAAPQRPAEVSARKSEVQPATVGSSEQLGAARIGSIVTFNDSEWVIIEAKDMGARLESNNRFQKGVSSAEGKYIRIKFSIKNNGKRDERLFVRPKLVDARNREFSHIDFEGFYIPKDAKDLGLEKIPVGLKKEFYTIFEIPKDASGLKFQARALAMGGESKLVETGL